MPLRIRHRAPGVGASAGRGTCRCQLERLGVATPRAHPGRGVGVTRSPWPREARPRPRQTLPRGSVVEVL